jgi:serine phosphatase RsbU (regulator of sigma subunit)/pSer/pThr/pTyr-binding forkhead associated (FHA) protein
MPPSLHVLKGVNAGQHISLSGDKIVLGRSPDCQVVIPENSVSRAHAHILCIQGKYYIEDQRSRNHTFVNNQQISTRVALKNDDTIRICDFVAVFEDQPNKPLPAFMERPSEELEEDIDHPTVEATLQHQTSLLIEAQSAAQVRALLEISSNLSNTLELDHLLPRIVDSLFQLFRQADRCFIILHEEASGRLMPRVIKTRRPQEEANARFSRSIVKQCLESKQLYLSNNAETDPRVVSQSIVDFRIRSVMCAPLVTGDGKPFGVIQLDTQDRNKKFSQDDLNLLLGVANQASIALENARLYREVQERARLERDMQVAHQVQRSFLPQRMPNLPSYEFFAHYEPAQTVGGDYYDFVTMGAKRLAINVGDVAGKGVAAALLMAKLSSDARYCLLSENDVLSALARLNNLVCQGAGQMQRFITLATVILDADNHSAMAFNAGHMSPLLYNGTTGTITEIVSRQDSGLPMGIMEDQAYTATQVALTAGDCLILFSDGVTDAESARKTAFGQKGLVASLKSDGPGNPRSLGERIVKAVKQHASGRAQNDDITLVCFGRIA